MSWDEKELIRLIEESETKADVLRGLGKQLKAGNYRTLDRHIKKLGLDISHFKGRSAGGLRSKSARTKPFSEILIRDSDYANNTSLKRRLLNAGFLKAKCYVCDSLPIWRDKRLVLILDHINGVHTDNRLVNLRLVCPNCDSQLDTFCSRNRK